MKTLPNVRVVLLLSTIIIIIGACKPTAKESVISESGTKQPYSVSVNADANIAVVQKFLDAQVKGDSKTMSTLITDDFWSRNPAGDTLYTEQYLANWKMLNETRSNQDLGIFATNSQTVSEGPLVGEWVMFWGSYSAVGIKKPTVFEVLWHADFLIKDGKISRIVSYFDMVDPDEADM